MMKMTQIIAQGLNGAYRVVGRLMGLRSNNDIIRQIVYGLSSAGPGEVDVDHRELKINISLRSICQSDG